jgi:23S rRNA-/tRNA-specific pseudouridylate synthase
MKSKVSFTLRIDEKTLRLDKAIRKQYPDWGRQAVGILIQNRQVMVNGKSVWLASWKVHAGDLVEITDPPKDKPSSINSFDPSWLVADAGDLLVVSKPAGLLSQATRAGGTDDLLNLTQAAFGEKLHLFHRLDRDTSGICLLTRPGPVNGYLDAAFKARTVVKEYIGLVSGRGGLTQEGELRSYLARDKKRSDRMQAVEKGKICFHGI